MRGPLLKFNWRSKDAIDLVRKIRPGLTASYDHDQMRMLVAPIEQVQHYGTVYRCRYVFLIHEEGLMVMRLHLEPDAVRTSPRPQRTRSTYVHQRVVSSSTISDKFSDMSINETHLEAHIGRMEYKQVPWSATSGLTVKLALYCLVRLAAEDGSDLKEEYPPLLSTVEPAPPRHVPQAAPLPSPLPRNPTLTTSTGPNTPRTSSTTAGHFYDTTVRWNSARTGYSYTDNNNEWVSNDAPSKWKVYGDKMIRLDGHPPYPRANKLP